MKVKVDYSIFNVKTALLYLWQLPQTVLAVLFIMICRMIFWKSEFLPFTNGGLTVWELRSNVEKSPFCFSLGAFVFTPREVSVETLKHESGHSVQSMILGPAYLLAVAIPSVILILIKKSRKKDSEWYHAHYPENWADKLGEEQTETSCK